MEFILTMKTAARDLCVELIILGADRGWDLRLGGWIFRLGFFGSLCLRIEGNCSEEFTLWFKVWLKMM